MLHPVGHLVVPRAAKIKSVCVVKGPVCSLRFCTNYIRSVGSKIVENCRGFECILTSSRCAFADNIKVKKQVLANVKYNAVYTVHNK